MEIDRRILSKASRQHGILTTAELIDSVLSHRQVGARVRAGWLDRLHPGVYRIGGSVQSFEQASLAACRAIGGQVALSHRAAATIWGLGLPGPAPVEVTTGPGRSARLPHVVVHRSADLVAAQITRRPLLSASRSAGRSCLCRRNDYCRSGPIRARRQC
jgi:predicted transcriptional regulator of viral defense system